MKKKATWFFKRVISMLTSMGRAKTLSLKSRTNALRTRLIIFSLLRDKKILMPTSISQKFHALLGHRHKNGEEEVEEEEEERDGVNQGKGALVLFNHNSNTMSFHNNPIDTLFLENSIEDHDKDNNLNEYDDDQEEEERYPDLTHTLFESADDMGLEDRGGSVIEMVKNSKEEAGEEFRLEDEIDQVADLFIRKFHRQMRLQKQLSLKRHDQEMLQRSA
ncbi:hypothetical protein K2173_003986 [Erythroxylum novogranatense]|uniref:Uncharacterized protein n=1 Tax=Erythroxylum novogranatense TaxID=1862640 RepID=A0AAV8SJF0_9ROSI|nr:hypothetical protein K2173_003986 [Erythroxylum novogranatense]